jgi:PEP-CTERM motif-containing protein
MSTTPRHPIAIARAIAIAGLAALASVAHATLLSTAPSNAGSVLDFDTHPVVERTQGPVSLTANDGKEVVFTTFNPAGEAGFSVDSYGLGYNGMWYAADHSFAWVDGDQNGGLNSFMRFTFSAPVSSVGGLLNYATYPIGPGVEPLNPDYNPLNFSISALGRDGTVLEQYFIHEAAPINSPEGISTINYGEFRGIQRGAADIYAFEMRGGGSVIRDLSFVSSVPEPGMAAMLLSGLALLGVARTRRR